MLAYTSIATVGALTLAARRPGVWNELPPRVRNAVNATGLMVLAQAGLGISTLLLYVPVPLAAFHQVRTPRQVPPSASPHTVPMGVRGWCTASIAPLMH